MAIDLKNLSDETLVHKFEFLCCGDVGPAKTNAECVRIDAVRKVLLERLRLRSQQITQLKWDLDHKVC